MTIQRPAASTAIRRSAIDPARAWILGIVVEDDGRLSPAPVAAGPHLAVAWAETTPGAAVEPPACTCPDYCALDHVGA